MRRHPHLLALILYVGLVLLVFSPLVLNLGGTLLTNTLGVSQDKWHFIWNFWWFKQAIFTGQNPYFTSSFFYPSGAPLALQTLDYMDAAISLPIAGLFGEIVAFNFIALLSIVLSGFFAYLLAWHLTRSWLGSFSAGVVFAFFPQHISQLYAGHPNLASLEWLPAYLLCLMLTFETGRLRYAVLGGVALGAITYTELELLFMAGIATLVYLLYFVIQKRWSALTLRNILLLGTLIGVWAVVVSPFLYQVYLLLASGGRTPPPLLSVIVNSASPAYYFVPSPYNYPLSGLVRPLYVSAFLPGGAAQWVIFVGWTTLAASVLGGLLSKDPRRYFFVALGVTALYLSLGPSGNPGPSLQSPLTALYTDVSFLDFFRTPARLSTLLMLSMSCLTAMGVKRLSNSSSSLGWLRRAPSSIGGLSARSLGPSAWGRIAAVACIGLILLEFAPIVATSNPTYYPAYELIPSGPNQFSVLNIPARVYPNQFYLYQSTLDGIPVVNGKLSQLLQTLPSYMYVDPFLRLLAAPLTSRLFPDPIHQNLTDAQLAPVVMSEYNVKYIVLYRYEANTRTNFTANLGAHTSWGLVNSTLYAGLGAPVYKDNSTSIFEVQQFYSSSQISSLASLGPIVIPGEGWGAPGVGGRNSTTPSQLLVYASTTRVYKLDVSYSGPTLCINNENVTMVANCGGPPTGTTYSYGIPLIQGLNVLTFVSNPPSILIIHYLAFGSQ